MAKKEKGDERKSFEWEDLHQAPASASMPLLQIYRTAP